MNYIKYVVNSIKKALILNSIQAYIYIDSDENIDASYNARVKNDLLTGNTTFILQIEVNGNYYDALNPDKYYLLNKYISRITSGGEIEKRRIIAYDNITGQITIESGFSEDVLTTDALTLFTLDSIYLTDLTTIDYGGDYYNNIVKIRIDGYIKTKEDSKREKANNIIANLQDIYGSDRNLIIYDDSDNQIGYMFFDDNGSFTKISDSGSQEIKYLSSVVVKCFIKR